MAQEEERRRVAYEVHDELAQVAASTHQHLQAFARYHRPRSIQAMEALDQVTGLAHRTVNEARRVIANLRPTTLDDFGLAAAIRLKVEDLQAKVGRSPIRNPWERCVCRQSPRLPSFGWRKRR